MFSKEYSDQHVEYKHIKQNMWRTNSAAQNVHLLNMVILSFITKTDF